MKLQQIGMIVSLGLLFLVPAQGAELGKEVFQAKCIGCHAMSCNRNGPKLAGIIGREVGSVPDFEGYSIEMKSAGFVWTREKLDNFLSDPNDMVPGTLMESVENVENKDDRRNLIDFLLSGDTSLDLCF